MFYGQKIAQIFLFAYASNFANAALPIPPQEVFDPIVYETHSEYARETCGNMLGRNTDEKVLIQRQADMHRLTELSPRSAEFKRLMEPFKKSVEEMHRLNQPPFHSQVAQLNVYHPIKVVKKGQSTERYLYLWSIYKGQMYSIIKNRRSLLKPRSLLMTQIRRDMRRLLTKEYARSGYSKDEIMRALQVERALDPGRKIFVTFSLPQSLDAALMLRLYDGSKEVKLKTPKGGFNKPERYFWTETLKDTRLPLEISYPEVHIDLPYKIELGRFAKNKSILSMRPALSWMAGQILFMHGDENTKMINPELVIFITAHQAQQIYYQRGGFELAPLKYQPNEGAHEVVMMMPGQKFYDLFHLEDEIQSMPWLKPNQAK